MQVSELFRLVLSSRWEIEPIFGLQAFQKAMADAENVRNGVPSSEVYSPLIEASRPRVILPEASGVKPSAGPVDLNGDVPRGSVAHLKLSGVMQLNDGLCTRGVRSLAADIAAADANPNISGILLEVYSGGGQAISGSELQNALFDVQNNGRTRTRVYSQMLASAALRGTVTADKIYASSASAFVGSVGVMYSVDRELLADLRENIEDFYAEQSTLKNEEIRALLEGNSGPLVRMLTEQAEIFINEVFQYRKIKTSPRNVEKIEAGKTFTANVAAQMGLIDGIATFGEVLADLRKETRTAPRRTYQLTNESAMTSKGIKQFLAGLIPVLNTKLGTEISAEANEEDVLQAVTGAESIEDVRAALQKGQDEQAGEITTMSESLDALTARLDEVTQKLEDLEKVNAELKADKADLEKKVVDAVGRKDATNPAKGKAGNAPAPDAKQFQTVQGFTLATTAPSEESEF